MAKEPQVSVIVPVYNVERFFERCLRSLFGQTLQDIEYIFVNDCTPDGSIDLLKRIMEEFPERKAQVRIVEHEKNRGLGAARNTGLRHAGGTYVIHCDSDDWVDSDLYEKMYGKALDEDADIVCCNVSLEQDGSRERMEYPYRMENRATLLNLRFLSGGIYSSTWNKLVKKSLYTENGLTFYDGVNMWEDTGITVRLRYFSKKTVVTDEALYHYNLQNTGSIVSVPKKSSVMEQVRCAGLLEEFFREQEVSGEYSLVIDYLKFMSKNALLRRRPIMDVKLWKTIYPESHRSVRHYDNLPVAWRFNYRIAAMGLPKTACVLFYMDQKRQSVLYRIKHLIHRINKWFY